MPPRLVASRAKVKAKAEAKTRAKAKVKVTAKAKAEAKAKVKAKAKAPGAHPVLFAGSYDKHPMVEVFGELDLSAFGEGVEYPYSDNAPVRKRLQALPPSTVKSTAVKLQKILGEELHGDHSPIVVMVVQDPWRSLQDTLWSVLGLRDHVLPKSSMSVMSMTPQEFRDRALACNGWDPEEGEDGELNSSKAAKLMGERLTNHFVVNFPVDPGYAPLVYGGFLDGCLLAILLLEMEESYY